MCGLAGCTRLSKYVSRGVAQRITEALAHRGPDQHGIFEGSEATLCAVRLKIIDLAGGDQPIVSDDGDTAIAFNGEIYNHREVRSELEALGHRFRSQCDTETVLRAFLQWDTRTRSSRLRGMFADRAVDGIAEAPVAGAGPDGDQAAVLLSQRGRYLFRVGAEGDIRAPGRAAASGSESAHWTPIFQSITFRDRRRWCRGIRKLSSGHLLEWRHGKAWSEAWWKRPAAEKAAAFRWSAAKEELDGLLTASVREHLVSDVPLGVWASGGLDSSAILHYAAALTTGRLKTFSVSFQGRSFDESPYFREIASNYGTDHHEFDLNPDVELQGAIEDFAYYSDEPSADAGALPVWFLSRMSRQHVTVALSGEGADELFGGYVTYQADRLAQPFRMVPKGLRRLMRGALDRYLHRFPTRRSVWNIS